MEGKKVFWLRFALWTVFALVLPVAFIAWRYELFSTVTKLNVSGWGLVAIVIVAVFVLTLGKYIRTALAVKWTMIGQILGGVCKVVIPMLTVILAVACIKSNVDNFIQAMSISLVSECVAIPLNPFPKWVYDLSKGETQDLIEYLSTKKKEGK